MFYSDFNFLLDKILIKMSFNESCPQILLGKPINIFLYSKWKARVARLKYEKIAKFEANYSQNSRGKLKNSQKLATFLKFKRLESQNYKSLFLVEFIKLHF